MVNLNIRVKQFAMPESGERKRNLTTLVLVKRAAVKRSRSPTEGLRVLMDEPLINSIQAILRATMGGMCLASTEGIATLQSLCQEVGCSYHDKLCSTTCYVALVVLWMGLHQEKFSLLATSLQAAAGRRCSFSLSSNSSSLSGSDSPCSA